MSPMPSPFYDFPWKRIGSTRLLWTEEKATFREHGWHDENEFRSIDLFERGIASTMNLVENMDGDHEKRGGK